MDNLAVIHLINTAPPQFKEVKNVDTTKPWVKFGDANNYPDYLVDLLNGSAKHNAIVTGKTQYVYGRGLVPTKETTDPARVEAYLDGINPYDTIEELNAKTIMDMEVFNGFYWKLVFTRGGILKNVVHVPFTKVRMHSDGRKAYISDLFDKQGTTVRDCEVFDIYNGINKGVKILAWRAYRPKKGSEPDVYPLPDYVGAIPYIDMDREIANFHFNNLKRGFVGSKMIVFFNGEPTDEEKGIIEGKLNKKFTGTDNAGKLVVSYNAPNQQAPQILDLAASDFDEQFITLNKQVQQEIFSGHKITSPELFGVATEGSLGDRNATIEKYELFKKTYVQNRQNALAEVWNNVLRLARVPGKVEFKELKPLDIQFSEATMAAILTNNELREMIGYEPLVEQVQPAPVQMAAQDRTDDVIQLFSNCGVPKADYEILAVRRKKFSSDVEAARFEAEVLKMAFVELSQKEKQLIEIVKGNPAIAIPDLAKALKITVDKTNEMLTTLTDTGVVEIVDGEINVLKPVQKPITEIVVMYEYAKAPNVKGDVVLPTTRDFCRRLIGLDRLYSRQEINNISATTGRDVWTERGGWYTAKGSDVSTPYCRHVWQQVIAVKRG